MLNIQEAQLPQFIAFAWARAKVFQWERDIKIYKEAGAFEAPRQTKEELCANDSSRHPKVFKLGPEHGCQ